MMYGIRRRYEHRRFPCDWQSRRIRRFGLHICPCVMVRNVCSQCWSFEYYARSTCAVRPTWSSARPGYSRAESSLPSLRGRSKIILNKERSKQSLKQIVSMKFLYIPVFSCKYLIAVFSIFVERQISSCSCSKISRMRMCGKAALNS